MNLDIYIYITIYTYIMNLYKLNKKVVVHWSS